MLNICNVSKVFEKSKKKITAVNNVNLNIKSGEVVCILGHNGAGKTTLIKCISGLIIPTSGDITIEGKSVLKNTNIPKEKIGAVLEGSRNIYYYLTLKENLKYFGLLNNLSKAQIEERTEYYLNLLDLKGRENDMVREFSRGMQQKVAIMVALMKNPDILMLDEPTLGLDIISSNIVKDVIKELSEKWNKTIVITTHDVSLIENLNSRVIFMRNGNVVKDDSLSNLKSVLSKDSDYEIIVTTESFEKCDKNHRNLVTVISDDDNLTTLSTNNLNWISNNMTKLNIISMTKQEKSFESIYSQIIQEGDCNEKV